MVYRQQIANATFPTVSGNLIQVTPLIEHIPWQGEQITYGGVFTIPDLLFGAASEFYRDFHYYYLYVRDQQPVLIGASYHYYVVRFNAKHEPAETIDAGTVTIPPN